MNTSAQPSVSGRTVSITRIFDADRETLFEAWTNPEHVGHWFGPNGFSLTIYEMDVRPNGVWRFTMHGPDGTYFPNLVTYKEIVRPQRLVYLQGDDQEHDRFEVTVTFAELGEQTELHMTSAFKREEDLREAIEKYGALEGMRDTMDRLAHRIAFFSTRS